MTVMEMVTTVKGRTHDRDDTLVITELNGAQSWAFNRIYLTQGGPDVLVTIDEEVTLAADLRTVNLDTEVTYEIAGIKQLWLKLPTENGFTQMISVDASDSRFELRDSLDTPTPSASHPVYYYIGNFTQARFSALLPTASVIRVDYFRRPPGLDPTSNDALTNGNDLPAAFHDAICAHATGRRFSLLDDDRDMRWLDLAQRGLNDALYHLVSRVQGPTVTQPFRATRRRVI